MMNRRALLLCSTLLSAAGAAAAAPPPAATATPPPVPVAQRGPAVGTKIPAFQARDQFGVEQDLASLAGPEGLVLLFVRSADW